MARAGTHGQNDSNFGATIRVVTPRNPALKLINNPFYGGQPETGSTLFGGKERGKKFGKGYRVKSVPRVVYDDRHILVG